MKALIVALLGISALAFAGDKPSPSPINAVFSEESDPKHPLEGLMIEINELGNLQLDSGTEIVTLENLERFLRSKKDIFSPRLIISSSNPSADYYQKAMKALLIFKKVCRAYSVVVIES